MMKSAFIAMAMVAAMASCTNTSTANVLIKNAGAADAANAEVALSMADVRRHLSAEDGVPFVLLDEKNRPVAYTLTAGADTMVFRVPVVRRGSQKTYSVNSGKPRLADNLLKFRRANITVTLR